MLLQDSQKQVMLEDSQKQLLVLGAMPPATWPNLAMQTCICLHPRPAYLDPDLCWMRPHHGHRVERGQASIGPAAAMNGRVLSPEIGFIMLYAAS